MTASDNCHGSSLSYDPNYTPSRRPRESEERYQQRLANRRAMLAARELKLAPRRAFEAAGRIRGGKPSRKWRRNHGITPSDAQALRLEAFGTQYPLVGGQRPSLADICHEALRRRNEPGIKAHIVSDKFTPRTAKQVAPLTRLGQVGEEFAQMLVTLPAHLPPPAVMQALSRWLGRAVLEHMPSVVFSGVCPDYATRMENGRPVYTFDSLGSGVGLVASRVLTVLPRLQEFVATHRLDVRFVVAIGDFEVDSAEVCARVGLSQAEFAVRLRQSQASFATAAQRATPDIRIETPFVTEVTGREHWDEYMAQARACADSNQLTGAFPLSQREFEAIATARGSLYQRWYGRDVDGSGLLRRQVPEYMSMGCVADAIGDNVLVLGADAAVMAPFWQGCSDHIRPVVYLRALSY